MQLSNQTLYFIAQAYRQVQLAVQRGQTPYLYGEFANQAQKLFERSGDEAFARDLLIRLVEEAGSVGENTDYLRAEMDFEAQALETGQRQPAAVDEGLAQRRQARVR